MLKIQMIIFISVFSGIYFLMHFYIYRGLLRGFTLSSSNVLLIKISFLFLGASFIVGEMASRMYGIGWLSDIGSVWMGTVAITLSFFILKDISYVIAPAGLKTYTVLSVILAVCVSFFSFFNVLSGYRIKKITLGVSGLPPSMSVFRIVQLSDMHLINSSSVKGLKKVIEDVNSLAPDIVAITGDLIDSDLCETEELCGEFGKIKSKYGVFAVTGNHEFYTGLPAFERLCAASGIRILANESVEIVPGIRLAGVHDPTAVRFHLKGHDLDGALNEIKPGTLTILLAHQPLRFKEAAKRGVSLQLSGHTHSGQIPPMDLIVRLVFRYAHGLSRYGNSYIYTTSGTGYWGPPMRFLSRSEVVCIDLMPVK